MYYNGKSIKGIFSYDSNLMYEYGDLVLYNNVLYKCTTSSSYVINEEPSELSSFDLYISDYLATSTDEVLEESSSAKLVPTNLLLSTLSSYLGGITQEGYIDESDFSTNELDGSITTQVRFLIGESITSVDSYGDLDLISGTSTRKLLRVYQNENLVSYQEITELDSGCSFFRTYESATWSSWSMKWGGDASTVASNFTELANELLDTVTTVKEKLNVIVENLSNFYSYYLVSTASEDTSNIVSFTDTYIRLSNSYIGSKATVIIFFSYTVNAVRYQKSVHLSVGKLQSMQEYVSVEEVTITISRKAPYVELSLSSDERDDLVIEQVLLSRVSLLDSYE